MADSPKRSDLGVRTASAIVMIAVAAAAYIMAGHVFTVFVMAVACGVFWEWSSLARKIARNGLSLSIWLAAGILYIGSAATVLIWLRDSGSGVVSPVIAMLGVVIATDIGAYFTGRTFGGPKIAPRISPSKTWSGLSGGMAASALFLSGMAYYVGGEVLHLHPAHAPLVGALLAIVAQAGDFFESWMKRCAGVKDSSHLIPGHGGLFDRLDGLLSVAIIVGSAIWLLLSESTL